MQILLHGAYLHMIYCDPIPILRCSTRLLEEQEREEHSKDESLRLLRSSGDPTDAASSPDSAAAARSVERGSSTRSSGGALGEVEMPQLGVDTEREQLQQRSRLSSLNGVATSDSSFSDTFVLEVGGGNFEDEFDPILASIRKPPQQQQQQPASTAAAKHASQREGPRTASSSPAPSGERKRASPLLPSPEHDADSRPSAGSTFAASFLSMLPGDMRAKAGEVMAQSSARITESANAFRSALDPGGAAPPAADKFKRRQSDPTYGGNSDLEEGRGVDRGGGRRAAAGEGDEDEVRLMNVNELLSEEEVRRSPPVLGGVYCDVCLSEFRWRDSGFCPL